MVFQVGGGIVSTDLPRAACVVSTGGLFIECGVKPRASALGI